MGRTRVFMSDNHTRSVTEQVLTRVEVMTRSRTIGIFAAPSVLASRSYAEIKRRYIAGLTVIEPDCYNWADLIEKNASQHIDLEVAVGEMLRWQADIILLGSSHYSSLKSRIETLAGPAVRVIEAYE